MAAPRATARAGAPVEGTHLPVAQRVVDVLDLPAGRRDRADVPPAAVGDPFT